MRDAIKSAVLEEHEPQPPPMQHRGSCSIAHTKLSKYKARVAAAIQQKKIFRIVSTYDAPIIKRELLKRGFIEQKTIPWHSIYYQVKLIDDLKLRIVWLLNFFRCLYKCWLRKPRETKKLSMHWFQS